MDGYGELKADHGAEPGNGLRFIRSDAGPELYCVNRKSNRDHGRERMRKEYPSPAHDWAT